MDFSNINYLKSGSKKQQLAFYALSELKIFEVLKDFSPILTGTIPIGIDVDNSDLDIICYCNDHQKFLTAINNNFKGFAEFTCYTNKNNCVVSRFLFQNFEIELFGQNLPTNQQYAYQHMLIEHQLIQKLGNNFRNKIIALKASGIKTEPAFAQLLGLTSTNPYEALLSYSIEELASFYKK